MNCVIQRVLSKRFLPYINNINSLRTFNNGSDNSKDKVTPGLNNFKVFKDDDATVILDVEEERSLIHRNIQPELVDKFKGLNLNRGQNGVFDLNDLVDLLINDRAEDLITIEIPKEMNYVDFMVIVSCNSRRHIMGLASFVIKVYKKKRCSSDPVPRIIGENCDWVALDLGNIVLHLMMPESRVKYDLESLWSVGPKYDRMASAEDELFKIIKKHNISLDDFKPSNQLG